MGRAVGSAGPWGPHLTWAAWLQHLQPGSNLSPLRHSLTMGSLPAVQMRKELHSGSAKFGTTEPALFSRQGFPVNVKK